jgi:hypothetical protein
MSDPKVAEEGMDPSLRWDDGRVRHSREGNGTPWPQVSPLREQGDISKIAPAFRHLDLVSTHELRKSLPQDRQAPLNPVGCAF